MKEINFINQNTERWNLYDKMLDGVDHENPDKLSDMFIQVTDDLSFARTNYPKSSITRYLNSIAFRLHQLIYINKKEDKKRFNMFWKQEFPLHIHNLKKYIYYSLIIFLVSMSIGAVSTLNDDTFVRMILGDDYVNMTLENMDKGDPLAVYKNMNQTDMFLGITFNNIKVSFYAYILGIIISIGTGYVLFYNGLMLGSFLAFFYQKGFFADAMLTIWIHGTLEIFAIIMAGAAGIILGNSILFPGTYSRLHSFMTGVKKSLKIAVGIIPMYVVAGFLEGFITRYTGAPVVIRLFIIFSSLAFIIWYFFILPGRLYKKIFRTK
ncbi:MAG: stage II sporulation protein M [Bacteroidota bacterium]